ncbi:hypothetical protein LP52_03825 [Streptomonospora alba]|uniref:Uncharacterized protein n=1 Tax=Streptomonospora alba TaxID=183763 RepID=A0A0C2G9F3_9ACTN|nr:hypothetical protein [Streptomonospora alba]KII00069.1 hypothetical protein LP52_03825 [Streptomonospora alba]
MTDDFSPEELAASRMSADSVQRRLDSDIAVVEQLARRGARVDTAADSPTLVRQLKEQAGSIGFESPIQAATMSRNRIGEIPVDMLPGESEIADLHAAAARLTSQGDLVSDFSASDGVRTIVLHSMHEEAAKTYVTLEVELRAAEGTAWLESCGWPRGTVRSPVHTFAGTPTEYLTQAEADLRNGAPHRFGRAMLMLFGAAIASGAAPPADAGRATPIAELLAANRGSLDGYVSTAESYSLSSESGWYGACLYRSALETAFEHFLGSSAFTLVDMEEINDIDEELQDLSADPELLPLAAVPAGAPTHHWWWFPGTDR